jgi:alpha-glucosidase
MSYTDAPDAHAKLLGFVSDCQKHKVPCSTFQLSSGYSSNEAKGGKRYVFEWNRDKVPDPPALAAAFGQAGMRLAANLKPCLLLDHPQYSECARRAPFSLCPAGIA